MLFKEFKMTNPAAGRPVKKKRANDGDSEGGKSHRSRKTSKSRRSAFTVGSKKGEDFASMTYE